MECILCNAQIQEDQAKTSLLCTHTYHTRCVMNHLVHNGTRVAVCSVCNEPVVPRDIFQYESDSDEDINTELEVVDTIYKTQPTFVGEIETLKKSSAFVKRTHGRLLKSATESSKTFHAELKDVVSFLKDKHKQKLKEFLKSDDYVEFRKSATKYLGSLRRFTNKWGVNEYMLGRYLRRNRINSIFILSGWRLARIKNRIVRKFRIRI
jgi:hypothetical protein